jgi:hypothetical protein
LPTVEPAAQRHTRGGQSRPDGADQRDGEARERQAAAPAAAAVSAAAATTAATTTGAEGATVIAAARS